MKKILFLSTLLSLLILAGCSNTANPSSIESTEEVKPTMEQTKTEDDHHEGETNVEPHIDEKTEPSMDQTENMDDHHEDEDNVEEHGHEDEMETSMNEDDHHEGETNVEPHDDNSDGPPSRN